MYEIIKVCTFHENVFISIRLGSSDDLKLKGYLRFKLIKG